MTDEVEPASKTGKTERQIQTLEMCVLKRIVWPLRWDRIHNENLREICEIIVFNRMDSGKKTDLK